MNLKDTETDAPTSVTTLRRGLLRWESGLGIVLLAVIIFGATEVPNFLGSTNLFHVGLNSGEIGIMALPMLLIIITGEIDLSVASMLGLSGAVAGVLFQAGAGIWLAIIVAIVVGAAGGFLNGFLMRPASDRRGAWSSDGGVCR